MKTPDLTGVGWSMSHVPFDGAQFDGLDRLDGKRKGLSHIDGSRKVDFCVHYVCTRSNN